MKLHIVGSLIFLMLMGCRSTPFRVETVSPKEPHTVAPSDEQLSKEFDATIDEATKARYKKANSPSFAIINGYYRLPNAKPFGAATIVRGYSYHTYFESLEITDTDPGFAIQPLSGDDAIGYNKALNALLNSGVKIKDIDMVDAISIAQAEAKASKEQKIFIASERLLPSVDYLISIYRASSPRGPVLIGRVIKDDGSLLAFRVLYQGGNNFLVGNLIISLFEDTINRI